MSYEPALHKIFHFPLSSCLLSSYLSHEFCFENLNVFDLSVKNRTTLILNDILSVVWSCNMRLCRSCLEIRIQDEITVWGLIIVVSRGWKILNIWEQLSHIKILLRKKLRAGWGQEMRAIIRCRIFCLPGCYPKILKINIYRTILLPVVLYGCETWSLTLR